MHRSLLFSTWQRMIVATCDCRYRVCRSTHFPVEHEEGKKESIPKKSAGKKGGKKKKPARIVLHVISKATGEHRAESISRVQHQSSPAGKANDPGN